MKEFNITEECIDCGKYVTDCTTAENRRKQLIFICKDCYDTQIAEAIAQGLIPDEE